MSDKNQESQTFGHRLRLERTRLKMTQSEFAVIGGVSKATQAAYEADATRPDVSYLARLAEARIDHGFLLTGVRTRKGVQWELLEEIRELVEEWAREQHSPPSEERKRLLCRNFYNQFCESGAIDAAELDATFRMVG